MVHRLMSLLKKLAKSLVQYYILQLIFIKSVEPFLSYLIQVLQVDINAYTFLQITPIIAHE